MSSEFKSLIAAIKTLSRLRSNALQDEKSERDEKYEQSVWDTIGSLIKNKTVLHETDEKKNTVLHFAVWHGLADVAKLLSEAGSLVNLATHSGQTPLHMAVEKKQLEIVQLLLEQGANPNTENKAGATPLEIAVEKNDVQMVQCLIERKADPKKATGKSRNRILDHLKYMFWNGSYTVDKRNKAREILACILEKGFHINELVDDCGGSLLHEAISQKKIEDVRDFLEKGADPFLVKKDIFDQIGETPFEHAILNDWQEGILLLLDHCAENPTYRAKIPESIQIGSRSEKTSFLYWAAEKRHVAIFQKLMHLQSDKEIDMQEKNDTSDTILHHIAQQQISAGHITTLLAKGALLDELNEKGETPLLLAVKNRNNLFAKELIKNGAKLYVSDQDGNTILHLALNHYNTDMVPFLLKMGVSIHEKNKEEQTPLSIAVNRNQPEMVLLLLQAGADADMPIVSTEYSFLQKANKKTTLMHWAAENGYIEIVDYLLALKKTKPGSINFNPDTLDYRAASPLSLAVSKNHTEVVERLLQDYSEPDEKIDIDMAKKTMEKQMAKHAVKNGNPSILQLLLDKKIIQFDDSYSEFFLLHDAIQKNDVQMVNILAQHKLFLDMPTGFSDDTPLGLASRNMCNPKIAETLLDAGADPDKENKNGESPLWLAASRRNSEVVRFLIEKGAKLPRIGEYDNMQVHPLYWMLLDNQRENVALFLEKQSGLWKFEDLYPIFLEVVEHPHSGYMSSKKMIKYAPLKIDEKDQKKYAAELFRKAVNSSPYNTTVMKFLLDNKMVPYDKLEEIGLESIRSKTSDLLHWAVSERYYDVAHLLLRNGADPNSKYSHEITPLKILKNSADTIDAKDENMAKLLLVYGADIQKEQPPVFRAWIQRQDHFQPFLAISHVIQKAENTTSDTWKTELQRMIALKDEAEIIVEPWKMIKQEDIGLWKTIKRNTAVCAELRTLAPEKWFQAIWLFELNHFVKEALEPAVRDYVAYVKANGYRPEDWYPGAPWAQLPAMVRAVIGWMVAQQAVEEEKTTADHRITLDRVVDTLSRVFTKTDTKSEQDAVLRAYLSPVWESEEKAKQQVKQVKWLVDFCNGRWHEKYEEDDKFLVFSKEIFEGDHVLFKKMLGSDKSDLIQYGFLLLWSRVDRWTELAKAGIFDLREKEWQLFQEEWQAMKKVKDGSHARNFFDYSIGYTPKFFMLDFVKTVRELDSLFFEKAELDNVDKRARRQRLFEFSDMTGFFDALKDISKKRPFENEYLAFLWEFLSESKQFLVEWKMPQILNLAIDGILKLDHEKWVSCEEQIREIFVQKSVDSKGEDVDISAPEYQDTPFKLATSFFEKALKSHCDENPTILEKLADGSDPDHAAMCARLLTFCQLTGYTDVLQEKVKEAVGTADHGYWLQLLQVVSRQVVTSGDQALVAQTSLYMLLQKQASEKSVPEAAARESGGKEAKSDPTRRRPLH